MGSTLQPGPWSSSRAPEAPCLRRNAWELFWTWRWRVEISGTPRKEMQKRDGNYIWIYQRPFVGPYFQYPVRYVLADTEVIAQSNSIQANQQNLPKSRMVTGASTKQEAAAPDQNVHGYAKPWYHGFSGNNCCKKWMLSPPVHTIHTWKSKAFD